MIGAIDWTTQSGLEPQISSGGAAVEFAVPWNLLEKGED